MSVLRTYLGRAAVACVEHGFRCSPSGGALCFPLSAVRGGMVAPFGLGVWLLLGAVPYVVAGVWRGGLRRGRRAGPGVRGMFCAPGSRGMLERGLLVAATFQEARIKRQRTS